MLSGSQADNKIRKGLEQAAQTVKQKLESGQAQLIRIITRIINNNRKKHT